MNITYTANRRRWQAMYHLTYNKDNVPWSGEGIGQLINLSDRITRPSKQTARGPVIDHTGRLLLYTEDGRCRSLYIFIYLYIYIYIPMTAEIEDDVGGRS